MNIKIELLGYKGTLTHMSPRLAYPPWYKEDKLLVDIEFEEPFPASIVSTAISIPVKVYTPEEFLCVVKREGQLQLSLSLEKQRSGDEKRKWEHDRRLELQALTDSLEAKFKEREYRLALR